MGLVDRIGLVADASYFRNVIRARFCVLTHGGVVGLSSARRFIAAALFVAVTSSAFAQQQLGSEDQPTFVINKFIVEGKNPLSSGETRRLLAPFRDKPLTIEELRKASGEVEKELALQGYNFYRAALPPQELKQGTVRIEIKRIEIDKVTVTGNQNFSVKNIKRSMRRVASGNSPNTQKIASDLLLAEDNPAKDIKIVFVKGEQPQTVDANLSVTDQNPNEMFLWANNAGSRITSKSRLGFQYHHRNLFDLDHQLALSYTISPEETSELKQYGLSYRAPVYTTRGMLNAFYSKSNADTGRVADVFDVSGAGETLGIGYTQYFDKKGKYQHRLKLAVTDKLFDNEVFFNTENIGSDVRSRPVSIEYITRFDHSNWLLNSILTHSQNISGGSFNDAQSYAASTAGATDDWSKQEWMLRLDMQHNQFWRSKVTMYAQSTSDVLIGAEKFGMGGALGDHGPRGFYEREVTVDEGYKGSIEVTRNFPVKKMLLGVFYDYATGDRRNPQAGEAASETLASIGLSYKWNIRKDLSLNADYGYVLKGVDQALSSGTDDGDSRLHVSIKYFPRWPFGGAK